MLLPAGDKELSVRLGRPYAARLAQPRLNRTFPGSRRGHRNLRLVGDPASPRALDELDRLQGPSHFFEVVHLA